jgi:DNA modification methylase
VYTLIHGDCTNVLREMPDKSVDCIVTDPPYVIGAKGGGMAKDLQYLREIEAAGMADGFDPVLLDEFLRVLKRPNLVAFCSRLQLRDYLNWAHKNDLNWAIICWHKPNPAPLMRNSYLPDTEYAIHFWKGVKLGGHYHTRRRFYVHPSAKRREFAHPTVKPLHIVKTLLLNAATTPGSLVLDPFAGTATTGVAAIQLGHRFIGVERNADYLAIAQKRLSDARPDFEQTVELIIEKGTIRNVRNT